MLMRGSTTKTFVTDPGEGGEEAEGNDGSGGVRALSQWQLVWRGRLPLIGQKTEANEPEKACQACRRTTQVKQSRHKAHCTQLQDTICVGFNIEKA